MKVRVCGVVLCGSSESGGVVVVVVVVMVSVTW